MSGVMRFCIAVHPMHPPRFVVRPWCSIPKDEFWKMRTRTTLDAGAFFNATKDEATSMHLYVLSNFLVYNHACHHQIRPS